MGSDHVEKLFLVTADEYKNLKKRVSTLTGELEATKKKQIPDEQPAVEPPEEEKPPSPEPTPLPSPPSPTPGVSRTKNAVTDLISSLPPKISAKAYRILTEMKRRRTVLDFESVSGRVSLFGRPPPSGTLKIGSVVKLLLYPDGGGAVVDPEDLQTLLTAMRTMKFPESYIANPTIRVKLAPKSQPQAKKSRPLPAPAKKKKTAQTVKWLPLGRRGKK